MKKSKILLYDIETTPNLGYTWGKYDQVVLSYVKEREMLSFAYKWLGEKRVHCVTRKGEKTDKNLVKKLASILDKADITVAHNGDKFDRAIVKTRMLYWEMRPLKPNCSVDTYRVAKAYFNFNGNGLNDLCSFLKIGKKLPHKGIDMWLGCMADKRQSWEEMVRYNTHDVVLLEPVYNRLQPWIENHPNVAKLLNPGSALNDCPNCASKDTMKYGFRVTGQSLQQRWLCKACGRNFLTRYKKP